MFTLLPFWLLHAQRRPESPPRSPQDRLRRSLSRSFGANAALGGPMQPLGALGGAPEAPQTALR
eukprot:3415840-Pyramimonas_sp.AAC.1